MGRSTFSRGLKQAFTVGAFAKVAGNSRLLGMIKCGEPIAIDRMRISQFPLFTLKETPADADVISHQLMIRAGLIRGLASGIYTWMPLGLRCLRKVSAIVREEMDAAGAIELGMPCVQPAKLWKESGRWDEYGPELLRIIDRHENEFVFGPTHEEVITDIARRELISYRQLPVNFYQIQTKFRDEIRPRFGIMRSREFLMKDAYSFHIDDASLDETYQTMFKAYTRIFERLQLDFRAVRADTGSIGGDFSHEFHVLADSGEDAIAFSPDSDYAANVEVVPAPIPDTKRPEASETMRVVDTPGVTTIAGLSKLLGIPQQQCLKAIFVKGAKGGIVGLFLRGDHTLNVIKAAKHPAIADPVEFASREEIIDAIGCPPGSLGPIGLSVPVLIDHAAGVLADFAVGANDEGKHITGVNWERDLPCPEAFDLRNIEVGEPAPDGGGTIAIQRGIEVGHIFKLGDKYSRDMQFTVLNKDDSSITPKMGCYGIGVSRIVAAAIEQNHDDKGIIWPQAIAPFVLMLTPIQYSRDDGTRETAERLYKEFTGRGIETLLDDRDIRPGIMFADSDLIGLPYRLVISPKSIGNKQVELKSRRDEEPQMLALEDCVETVCRIIKGND